MSTSRAILLSLLPFFFCQPLLAAGTIDDQLIDFQLIPIDTVDFLSKAQAGTFTLTLGGQQVELILEEYSLFSEETQSFRSDGLNRIPFPHNPPTTFRGVVRGFPSSYLNLTLSRDLSWVRGFVTFDDRWFFIQPRFEETPVSGRSELIVYEPHNVKEIAGSCGTLDSQTTVIEPSWIQDGGPSRGNLYLVPMVDTQFVNINPDNWVDRMLAQISSVHTLLFNQNVVSFVVLEYGIFTGSDSFDADTILDAMKYNLTKNFDRRQHIVHLLTGKNLDGNTLGLAPPGANVGRCMGYSLAQCVNDGGFSATDYQKMLVSCHELGHNMGATHEQAVQGSHWNIFCGWVGYSIMSPNWVDACMLDYFSGPNVSSMQSFLTVLDWGHPGSCNFEINHGSTYTTSADVNCSGSASTFFWDFSRRGSFVFSNSQASGLDVACCTSDEIGASLNLTSGDGIKEVFLYAYDANENILSSSNTIILDTTEPGSVTELSSPSHVVDEPGSDSFVDVVWQAAWDLTSGVAGYSILWHEDPVSQPDENIDLDAGTFASTSAELSFGQWYFSIRAQDAAGLTGPVVRLGPFIITSASAVDPEDLNTPLRTTLLDNYPDPFNPLTTLKFGLPQVGNADLRIYDASGRLVKTLLNEELASGFHTVTWDGRNDKGIAVTSGIYFYRLLTEGFSEARKMVLIR